MLLHSTNIADPPTPRTSGPVAWKSLFHSPEEYVRSRFSAWVPKKDTQRKHMSNPSTAAEL